MSRANYLLPRLLLLSVLIVGTWFAMDPLAERVMLHLIPALTDARVAIGSVNPIWRKRQLELTDLRIGEHAGLAIELDRAEFQFDTAALAHRRIIVTKGEARGVRFLHKSPDFDRHGSTAGGDDQRVAGELVDSGRAWFCSACASIDRVARQRLESKRLALDLMDHWPNKYEELEIRADQLRRQVVQMSSSTQSNAQNPLRTDRSHQQSIERANRLTKQIADIRGELDQIQIQIVQDKQAVADARQNDADIIAHDTQIVPIDGRELSRYMFGAKLQSYVHSIVRWIRLSRQLMPVDFNDSRILGRRGQRIRFDGIPDVPDFLVRCMNVQGQYRGDDHAVGFTGTATGLTNDPRAHGRPTEFVLQVETDRGEPASIRIMLDRTSDVPLDEISVGALAIRQRESELGQPDQFGVTVGTGTVHVDLVVEVHGENISGDILYDQPDARLAAFLPPELRGDMMQAIQSELDGIGSLRARATLHGTLRNPRFDVYSDLGDKLASVVNSSLEQQRIAVSRRIVQRAEEQLAAHSMTFENTLLAKRTAILATLEAADRQLRTNVQTVSSMSESPRFRIGRQTTTNGQ